MTTTAAPRRRPLALTAGPAPEPGRAPAVGVAAATVRASAAPGYPVLRDEQTRRLAPRPLGAPSPASDVVRWIGRACADAGEPVNVTVSAATHDAHIHVVEAAAFRSWCAHLHIPPGAVRRATTDLGVLAEATVTTNGWALHVRLFGPAVEELT